MSEDCIEPQFNGERCALEQALAGKAMDRAS